MTATRFSRLTTAGLRAAVFFKALALAGTAFRGRVTCFLAGLALPVLRLATFWAFFAGAFAPEPRLARDFGLVAFVGLSVRLLAAFGDARREAERLNPFVTGLLI